MLEGGIVAVGDICNNKLTIPQKIKGRISYHNFIEASGFVPQMAEQRFERAVDIFNTYAEQYLIPAVFQLYRASCSLFCFRRIMEKDHTFSRQSAHDHTQPGNGSRK